MALYGAHPRLERIVLPSSVCAIAHAATCPREPVHADDVPVAELCEDEGALEARCELQPARGEGMPDLQAHLGAAADSR